MNYIVIPGLKFQHGIRSYLSLDSDKQEVADRIMRVVSEYYGLTLEELTSKSRLRKRVLARHICSSLILKRTSFTLAEVAKMLGAKDHTTAIHSRKVLQDLLDTDENLKKEFLIITNKI